MNATAEKLRKLPCFLIGAPFLKWLEQQRLANFEVDADTLWESLGLVPRRVRDMQRGSAGVSFENVDRALTNAGTIVEVDGRPIYTIDDLYPDPNAQAALRKAIKKEHRAEMLTSREPSPELAMRLGCSLSSVQKIRRQNGWTCDYIPPTSRLTEKDVKEIRRRQARGEKGKDLAAHFGVREKTIREIVHYRSWKWVL